MQVVKHSSQISESGMRNIAFVATMGALHEGHATLIRRAKELSTNVVVSVFINPLQFSDPDDLEKYPQTPANDRAIAERAGASLLWLPDESEMYPGSLDQVRVGPVAQLFEGVHRGGHFEGALTAVKRLLDLVQPRWALFGEKDFQQLFLVHQMVQDLGIDVEIIPVPTVREADGLALSSRNIQLSQADRQSALVISKALRSAATQETLALMQQELESTLSQEPRFIGDYAAIIDEETFALASDETVAKRALIAGWVNGVRLIDNMPMKRLLP